MQHAPRVHDVVLPERVHEIRVERGRFLYLPRIVVAEVVLLQLERARDRLRIEVERMNTSTESARAQTEEPAARADVEKRLAFERANLEHFLERLFRLLNALVVDTSEGLQPVLTEFEAILLVDF